jgi:hypothetical protein
MCDTGLRNIRTLICPVPYLRSNLGVGNRMGGPRLEVVVLALHSALGDYQYLYLR